jgi:hypothetical protein
MRRARVLLFAAAVLSLSLAAPARADVPRQGSFGLGASFAGLATFNTASVATVESGLHALYWAMNSLRVNGDVGLVSTENAGTIFSFAGGAAYYFNQHTAGQLWPFVGGTFGLAIASPTGADTKVSVILLLGGGAEYLFSRNFGAQITEGLQLTTNATNFALVTRVGLNWYF